MSKNIDLITDLDTDLAFAFLVERRFVSSIRSDEALALIDRVLLEAASESERPTDKEHPRSVTAM